MANETWIQSQCQEVEDCLRITTRKHTSKSRTWQQRNRVNLQPYKTSRGSVSEENEILDRWTEYCPDLYNYETDGDPITWLPTDNR